MESTKSLPNLTPLDQSVGKYFSLVLGTELASHDTEGYEEIMQWTRTAVPDGVAPATLVDDEIAQTAIKSYLAIPAKHRQRPSIATPVVRFDVSEDSIWDPELSPKPFVLDYLDGPLGYRIARAESDSSPLRKALPRARDTTNKILWDLCGGWRVDALLAAHWGFEVHSFEKSPWAHLISDRALKRSKLLAEKELSLETYRQDAVEALDSLPLTERQSPSIIYIDPMYPHLSATALNQIEMRFLHQLSSGDDIAAQLLEQSLPIALDRVVIKRPVKAPELYRKPNFQVEQGSTRYDIYLRPE